jgi:hypothetical protein
MGKKISLNRAWLLLSVFFLLLFISGKGFQGTPP